MSHRFVMKQIAWQLMVTHLVHKGGWWAFEKEQTGPVVEVGHRSCYGYLHCYKRVEVSEVHLIKNAEGRLSRRSSVAS